jgi:hypothetical protein
MNNVPKTPSAVKNKASFLGIQLSIFNIYLF